MSSDKGADATQGRERMRQRYLQHGGKDGKGLTPEQAHQKSAELARRVERKESEKKGG